MEIETKPIDDVLKKLSLRRVNPFYLGKGLVQRHTHRAHFMKAYVFSEKAPTQEKLFLMGFSLFLMTTGRTILIMSSRPHTT
jgi:hypothetical protein